MSDFDDAGPAQREGGVVHLRQAVTDGPAGTAFVRLSGARAEGLRVRAANPQGFHCSRVLGGCGGALTLAAGAINAAHFRHGRGAAASCALARDPALAERALTHLLLQRELQEWLRRQGLCAEIEKRLAAGGRADLHVVIAARAQTIEVQLSPLPHDDWVRRGDLYRRQAAAVRWLYSPDVGGGLAEEEAETNGFSLLIRWEYQANPETATVLRVEIGTMTRSWVRWAPLQECRMTQRGFETPDVETAVVEHRRHQLELERARRAEEERLRSEHEARLRRRAVEGPAAHRAAGTRASGGPLPLPVGPLQASYGSDTLQTFLRSTPGFQEWQCGQDWHWLDAVTSTAVRQAMKAMTYLVTHAYVNGPVSGLTFADVPDDGLTERLLVQQGIIRIVEHAGARRWERG